MFGGSGKARAPVEGAKSLVGVVRVEGLIRERLGLQQPRPGRQRSERGTRWGDSGLRRTAA